MSLQPGESESPVTGGTAVKTIHGSLVSSNYKLSSSHQQPHLTSRTKTIQDTQSKRVLKKPPGTIGGFDSQQNYFTRVRDYVDPSGKLSFRGKAVLHAQGVDFSNGVSYKINMEEFKYIEELGKGQFGTVQKVLHMPTGAIMAMKEIRLELDESKLSQILMELDILHGSNSAYIIEFYGAFFVESCVYYCMEYMDAGSLDKLYGAGVPEDVLATMTISMVKGLQFMKDVLNKIHRDVKPTNVLANMKGEIKLCDFGVSGQLIRSLARTNVGCQSYMAPERIESQSTYTVQSDVWSLGLSIIELGSGKYPYPIPDKHSGFLGQIIAIINEDPPSLPADKFSEDSRDFVAQCLNKDPQARPTYAQLLEHPFLKTYENANVDMKGWVQKAYEARLAAANKRS
ncbi:4583_t:CDS:2 [Paraglomus brasilianum]|uniref:mitogen-activated protein kinase kinase n=1 Tax=Paraglomus brasilianum TaxID=144538 RepID=A0A9N9F8L9_9GLOM|nr:4583_t:CDS:2 [Paraglomus brasilianum]